jgi:hypothetical protein
VSVALASMFRWRERVPSRLCVQRHQPSATERLSTSLAQQSVGCEAA